jgi:peptidoglycan/xylan/chitin deacetylase (PgdA/CDA1 family)
MPPPVLAYHLVDRRMDAGIAWIPPGRFERQIEWLAESGYRSLSISEYLRHDNRSGGKHVAITFDDGYKSLGKYALPVLSRCHFRATVFVIAAYVGRRNRWDVKFFLPGLQHLDWGELRELLAAGWEIGSHSLHHEYLPLLSDQELRNDLSLSRQILQEHLQVPITHLSLPFGRGDRRVYLAAEEAGYVSVATLGGGKSRIENLQPPIRPASGSFDNPQSEIANRALHLIPRRGVYLLDSMRSFRQRVEAPPESKWQDWRQRAISTCAMGTVIVKMAKNSLTGQLKKMA